MTVHRFPAIPGKLKTGRKVNEAKKDSVAERIQKMRNRKTMAQKIGVKDSK